MYDELAPWWPLISSPADYEEEATQYLAMIRGAATRPVREVLVLARAAATTPRT